MERSSTSSKPTSSLDAPVVELVKLTDARGRTYDDMQWGEGTRHVIPPAKRQRELCHGGILHAYPALEVALLVCPNQVGWTWQESRIWRATTPEVIATNGTKCGVWELTTHEEMPYPAWWQDATTLHRIRVLFAGLCAEAVLDIFESKRPGDMRPRKAVELALEMARTGVFDRKADAADAAAAAAYAADAAAAYAADAAYAAADAAARAIRATTGAGRPILDTVALAKRAVAEITTLAAEGQVPA